VSRRSQAKQARRKKRQAGQNARWIPDTVLDALSEDIELAAVLEGLDEQLTERGWTFEDELSDEESALWTYPPSTSALVPEDVVPVTTIAMTPDDVDLVHVVLVGTTDDYQFALEELSDHIESIETYRLGAETPDF
jgi:hypothetical protein